VAQGNFLYFVLLRPLYLICDLRGNQEVIWRLFLKGEFNRLESEKAISDEIRMLVSSMLTLLELICSIFLEKKTTKNNQNSSKPSSQTDKDE